ncbi:serine hydrolase [Amycolatopsis sp. cmx-4-61]|uniref:serine hydrolase n=1 Tax=Amycolatopsis sp. cmx-4-61 TaxID=2790937 RepID=UPI00397CCF57
MLLQHSSGLYNYSDDLAGDPAGLQRHWEPRELVAMATAHPPRFPPGTSSKYSTTADLDTSPRLCSAAGCSDRPSWRR